MITHLKDFFSSGDEFIEIVNSIPVRKLIHQTDKDFVRKMKKYYKEYGEEMSLMESQAKRIKMLKDECME